MFNPEHLAWSRNLFASLKDGGMWCVPRTGLVFHRQGDSLVYDKALPDYDKAAQASDLDAIAAHFQAAGINVVR